MIATSQVIQHVISSITPASQAAGAAAHAKVHGAGTPHLEMLAARVAGAQHDASPRVAKRVVVVVAGDHGCGDPGIALGAEHPTVVAATAIADGTAALAALARPATVLLVDAGAQEPAHMPAIAVRLGRGPSRNLLREPALSIVDAVLGLEAGIALSLSLAAPSSAAVITASEASTIPDVIALGALGLGSEVASAALLGAALGRPAPLGEPDTDAEAAMAQGIALHTASGLELLATFGGSDTAVLAGLILGAASMNVPVILDSYATGAAALVAVRLAPDVAGYLVAAHRGTFTMPSILHALGLQPVFDGSLGHGEGTGAAMVLPLLDQIAALVTRG